MTERPPLPTLGKLVEAVEEYQSRAGFAGGRRRVPVLLGESFRGDSGDWRRISFFASKSKSGSASLGPTKYGQPKLAAERVALISS
ncbi:MAG: hypothetical protein RIS92_2202 [Verrucomicrobiota bacterium]